MLRSPGGTSFTMLPEMAIVPESGVSSPLMRRSKVVLPEPEGPTMVSNSPSEILRLRSLTAGVVAVLPKDLETWVRTTSGIVASQFERPSQDVQCEAAVGLWLLVRTFLRPPAGRPRHLL